MERFLVVIGLTVLIHLISTLAYSVRLAGVRTERLLTAFSLYNIIFLLVSFSNGLLAPLLTSIMETGIKTSLLQAGAGVGPGHLTEHEAYREYLVMLALHMRGVIAAATLGTLVGTVLIPCFVRVFIRAIGVFEATESLLRTFAAGVYAFPAERGRKRPCIKTAVPLLRVRTWPRLTLPKNVFIANILVTGIYTTSVLSAVYAGALFPDFRTTATVLSAAVNGFAAVLAALVVEPSASSITDEALRGERDESDVRQLAFYMALTRFLGTLLAQAFFLPLAYLIRLFAFFVV